MSKRDLSSNKYLFLQQRARDFASGIKGFALLDVAQSEWDNLMRARSLPRSDVKATRIATKAKELRDAQERPFNAARLVIFAIHALMAPCPICDCELTDANLEFAFDVMLFDPRHESDDLYSLDNIFALCSRCKDAKGFLSAFSFGEVAAAWIRGGVLEQERDNLSKGYTTLKQHEENIGRYYIKDPVNRFMAATMYGRQGRFREVPFACGKLQESKP